MCKSALKWRYNQDESANHRTRPNGKKCNFTNFLILTNLLNS